MKTKILVTGSEGQLGQTINELYSNDPEYDIKFVTKVELDITDNVAIQAIFKKHKFDYCINCAAYTNVEQAEEQIDLAFSINAEGVRNLAEACRKNNVILIHISTDYVFDGKKQTPYIEEDIPNPINVYGKSKLAGEACIQEIEPKYFIIRTSWLYSKYGHNFLKSIINKIQNNELLKITTCQRGTPTSCKDISEFIFNLIKSRNSNFGIYHFSAKGETTWFGFALQICSHFKNYNCKTISPVEVFKSKATRPNYSVLDNCKALKITKDQKNWRESVDETALSLISKSSQK